MPAKKRKAASAAKSADANPAKVKSAYAKWNRDREQAFEHRFDSLSGELDIRSIAAAAFAATQA